jgi:methionyl-tRNA formyltransferase
MADCMTGLRVAMLRSDAPHNEYHAAVLQNRFDVVAMVVEPGGEQRRALRVQRRWSDYGAALYHDTRRAVFGLSTYRRRYFADLPYVPPERRAVVHQVSTVNDVTVRRLLHQARPDVTVVTCTTVLNPQTIAAAGGPILNIHGGYLPDYRGWYGFFFAMYNRTFDKIGSTIHFIDAGIDTGDIVKVVQPTIHPADGPEQLYCRAERLAVHCLMDLLASLERGEHLPRQPQPYRCRLYRRRDRTPYHDIVFALRRRMNRVMSGRIDELPTLAARRAQLRRGQSRIPSLTNVSGGQLELWLCRIGLFFHINTQTLKVSDRVFNHFRHEVIDLVLP